MLEKPKDREVICHATAWDFFDGKVLTRVLLITSILEGDNHFTKLQDVPTLKIYQYVLFGLK